MREMLDAGTTLLLVSHNIDDIRRLCDHAVWIDHGKIVTSGKAEEICDRYINEV